MAIDDQVKDEKLISINISQVKKYDLIIKNKY